MNLHTKSSNKINCKYNTIVRTIVLYSVLFILLSLAVYAVFMLFGKSFIWGTDGITQHYPSLTYIGKWGRKVILNFLKGNFTVPIWDFSIGYGADAITTFHYYGLGDPLSLLSIIVPARYTEYLYNFLIILRLYLSGLFFIFYCNKMKKNGPLSVLGSFVYVFCAYALYAGVRHPFFLTPMVYFPLVLIGCEKIFKNENPLLFIASVSLCILSNFYFAFMVIIMTVIYVVIRFLYMKHENFVKEMLVTLGKLAGFGVIALLVAAVLLLPVVIVFMGSSRAGVSNYVPILFDIRYYEKLFGSFMGYSQIGQWNMSGYTPLALISVFYIFIKKKQYKPLKTAAIVLFVIQLIPFFGYMLNGFLYPTNRFVWAEAFLMAFIVVSTFKDIVNAPREVKVKLLSISCVYTLIFLLLRAGKTFSTISQYIFLFALLVVLVAGEIVFAKNIRQKVWTCVSLICAVSIVVSSTACFSPIYENYVSEFIDADKAYETVTSYESDLFEDEIKYTKTKFLRYESDNVGTSVNQSLFNKTAGHSYYFSFKNDYIDTFLNELKVPIDINYRYKNVNRRAYLYALTSTGYFISTNQNAVPYNFILKDSKENSTNGVTYNLFGNKTYLPIGYTYDSYITRTEYDKLSAMDRQETLMQSVLLEDAPSGYNEGTPLSTSYEVPYKIKYDSNIVEKDGGIYVKKANAAATLKFKSGKNCETYFCIENLDAVALDVHELQKALPEHYEYTTEFKKRLDFYNHIYKGDTTSFGIKVSANGADSQIRFRTKEDTVYSGIVDFNVNLGYNKTATTSCKITFPTAGFYSWDDIKIICQPMDNYNEYVNGLSEDVLKNVRITANKVSGKISLDEKKILCLSIPYSEGWTCYVDGQQTELLRANTWSMAIPLSEGDHEISVRYVTPGLKVGALLTCVGLALTVAVSLFYYYRRKKN